MATNRVKPRAALGNNPLSQGIFSRTVELISSDVEKDMEEEATVRTDNESSSPSTNLMKEESRFLIDELKEKVNLRLSVELNDWLDELLKKGKRQHGHKIAKEVWVQAALEFFRALPVNWQQIDSEESLKQTLLTLELRVKNQEKDFDFPDT